MTGTARRRAPGLIHPIGWLQTPFKSREACPRNVRQLQPAPECHAVLFPEFIAGLRDLDGFSHLIVLYWLDQATPGPLVFTPPFDSRPHGVFATRSPARPNPIGMAVVAFDGFAAPDRLRVRYLDCMDGTPLLDIKPYLPSTDSVPEATMGWLART
jgi:tRNA-Thr(GGU) m(6)t(6)A37 methyltransferase TsaA